MSENQELSITDLTLNIGRLWAAIDKAIDDLQRNRPSTLVISDLKKIKDQVIPKFYKQEESNK